MKRKKIIKRYSYFRLISFPLNNATVKKREMVKFEIKLIFIQMVERYEIVICYRTINIFLKKSREIILIYFFLTTKLRSSNSVKINKK